MPQVPNHHRSREPSLEVPRSMPRYLPLAIDQQSSYLPTMPVPTELTPLERAELLKKTSLFANIHADAANTGQTPVPANLDTDYHFTCFVQAPSYGDGKATGESGLRLIELDGRRVGPVDRGPSEDLLKVSTFASFKHNSDDILKRTKVRFRRTSRHT